MITIIPDWFFDLPVGKSLCICFFVFWAAALVTYAACDYVHRIIKWARRQYRLSKFADEFAYRDDPYAVLSYHVDPMRDDLHVEHAKSVLGARAASLTIPTTEYTCFYCSQQQDCGFAFDGYNTNGDCIMTK